MKIFRIFALLFLASCGEVTISVFSPCYYVTLSDALPVQFWLAGCSTYNETVPKGVHEACFCAPWQCDDEIKVQFKDEDASLSPDLIVYLASIDEDGNTLSAQEFDEIESDLFSASLIPNNHGICDEDIQLVIVSFDSAADEEMDNSSFESTIDPWINSGSGGDWAWNAGGYVEATLPSKDLLDNFSGKAAGWYIVEFEIDPQTANSVFNVLFRNSSTVIATIQEIIASTARATYTELIYVSAEFNNIAISADPSSGSPTFRIYNFSVKAATVLAQSDCLNIATTQDETELFEYSNARNFAGLVYQDISPDASFNIRVPCRFFHESFPEEDESMELTSQVVTTSSQQKSQKLLEVKHVPYYFHKKLQLILKHHTLTNNTIDYKKEEKYEIIEGNKRWPLKAATCLLTDKNSVLRNVL